VIDCVTHGIENVNLGKNLLELIIVEAIDEARVSVMALAADGHCEPNYDV
jgi:hypothetical protein